MSKQDTVPFGVAQRRTETQLYLDKGNKNIDKLAIPTIVQRQRIQNIKTFTTSHVDI